MTLNNNDLNIKHILLFQKANSLGGTRNLDYYGLTYCATQLVQTNLNQ